MRRRIFILFALLWTFFLPAEHTEAVALPKDAAVAVMDFGTRPGASTAEININRAEFTTSEYVITRLINRGYFSVAEKDLVMHELEAEGLRTTGIIDPDTAKQIGAMLGVRYLLYGNVVHVSVSSTGTEILTSVGGGIHICTVKAHVIARLMDVETGDILVMAKGDGSSKSSFVKVRGGPVSVVEIGTTRVTQDSVHNAIMKAAFATVDDLLLRLFQTEKSKEKKGGRL